MRVVVEVKALGHEVRDAILDTRVALMAERGLREETLVGTTAVE